MRLDSIYKKVPVIQLPAQLGAVVLLTLEYKLNNVCNAGSLPRGRSQCDLSSIRTRTIINHMVIVPQYIDFVKYYISIYSTRKASLLKYGFPAPAHVPAGSPCVCGVPMQNLPPLRPYRVLQMVSFVLTFLLYSHILTMKG